MGATGHRIPRRYPGRRNELIKPGNHQHPAKLYLNFYHNRHLGMIERDTATHAGLRIRYLLNNFTSSLRTSEAEVCYQEPERFLRLLGKASLHRSKSFRTQGQTPSKLHGSLVRVPTIHV
jgi:hypothetical protein